MRPRLASPRLRRALAYGRPHAGAVSGIVLLSLAGAALGALEPLVLKSLIDGLGGPDPLGGLARGLAVLLGIAAGREALAAGSTWWTWRTRLALHHRLLDETVGRIQRMPLSRLRAQGVGALLTRLDRGIQGSIGALTEIAFQVVPSVLYLGAAAAIMLRLEPRLAAVVLAFAPLPAILSVLSAPEQARRERTLLERWVRIYARFHEGLAGILTVRSFAMEEAERRRFLGDVDAANRVVIRGVAVDAGWGATGNLAAAVARLAAIGVGGLLVARGEVGVGTLVAFLGYVGGLFAPVQGLAGVYKTLERASVSLDEVFSILDLEEQLPDRPGAVDLPPLRGEIVFDGVRFGYEAAAPPLLERIDVYVRPGQTVALVGPSGAGKSTLVALLQRFHAPTEGRILVDGIDLAGVTQASLRRQIGVVLQEPLLFNDTVRANIAYGRPDAADAQVEAAARAAHADGFIRRLPQGYDTPVGERGGRLSLGERQRIAIARALVKDPPLVILDEATSSLDAESEALVQEALDRLLLGRTAFVIAHRLATVVRADKILVLRGGRIEEAGTHAELLAWDGYYASLVRRQTEGLLGGDIPVFPSKVP